MRRAQPLSQRIHRVRKELLFALAEKFSKQCYFRCQWRVWGSDGGKACCTFLENHHRRTFGKDAMSENLEYT